MKMIEKLDAVFSQFIRLRETVNGRCRCFTCGKSENWTEIHNGHFIDRRHMNTRFNERNCHPQCFTCNVEKRGNIEAYKKALINKYGDNILSDLEIEKNKISFNKKADYKCLLDFYNNELKRLKKEKLL